MDEEVIKNKLNELSYLSSNIFKYTDNKEYNKLLLKEYLCNSDFYDYCKKRYGSFTFSEFKKYLEEYEAQYGPIDDVGLAIYLYENIL